MCTCDPPPQLQASSSGWGCRPIGEDTLLVLLALPHLLPMLGVFAEVAAPFGRASTLSETVMVGARSMQPASGVGTVEVSKGAGGVAQRSGFTVSAGLTGTVVGISMSGNTIDPTDESARKSTLLTVR